MHVLVTGGAGFIGSHLCDALLERGDTVVCVDNLHLGRESNIAHQRDNPAFRFVKLDLLDRPALEQVFAAHKFEAVFHLAANSDIQAGAQDHELDLRLNFLTTCAVLEAMLAHGVRRIFFASTSAVFGDTPKVLHEDFGPLRPISFYGASKLSAEAYISVFVDNFQFQATILRFPNVVGPRATHGAIFDFIARLQQDSTQLTVLGNGTQNKPYLYVADLVRAILLVFDRADQPLAVYHAGNEDLVTVRQMAETVVEEMGLAGIPINYTQGNKGWVGDVPTFRYDFSRIRGLGFAPQYSSAEAVRLAARRILQPE